MSTKVYNYYDELNKETLLNEEDFIDDASSFLISRGGYKANELVSNEEVYDAFMEHFRSQNVNEITAIKDLNYAQEADDEKRAIMGRLMDTYDKMDGDFGYKAAADYLGGIFTAPSTYAGIFSFGAGKAGTVAAQQGIKMGIRNYLYQGLKTGGVQAGVLEGATTATLTATQEATRVETEIKKEIDPLQISMATGLSMVAGTTLGTAVSGLKVRSAYKGEQMAMNVQRMVDEATEEAHSTATKKVFEDSVTKDTANNFKDVLDASRAAADEEVADSATKEVKARKLALKESIPEELEKGRKLKVELTPEGTYPLSLEAKEIQNISAAAAKIDHLIPEAEFGKPGSVERFASRFTRALAGGYIDKKELSTILDEHSISIEQLGPLYAAELSRAGSILGSHGSVIKTLKENMTDTKRMFGFKSETYKKASKELNEIDDMTREFGILTSAARKELDKVELGDGALTKMSRLIPHLNKARIGLMTIQPITTIRNTTNGYFRNYVYALDNLGAGIANIAVKAPIQKGRSLLDPSDEVLKQEGVRAVRAGVAQLRTAGQSLLFKDLAFGIQSTQTQALLKVLQNPRFGKNELVKKLLRDMGDLSDLTGNEGGLIGAARFLNSFNTMSDNMFKRAIFSRELDKAIKANPVETIDKQGNPIRLSSLEDVIVNNKLDAIQSDEFSKAMAEALDFTYQTGGFNKVDGGFNVAADALIQFGQSTVGSTFIPFPRYLVNQFRFVYEHAPVIGMINSFGILNKPGKEGVKGLVDLSPEQIGKQLGGLGIIGALMAARANFGDETTDAVTYLDPTTNERFNAQAFLGPFAPYNVFIDFLYKNAGRKVNIAGQETTIPVWHDNKKIADIPQPVDYGLLVETLGAANLRVGTGNMIIDGFNQIMLDGWQKEESNQRIEEALIAYTGNILNSFTVGVGVVKDVMGTIDPDYRQVPSSAIVVERFSEDGNKIKVNILENLMIKAGRSFPRKVDEDTPKLESVTRPDGVRRINPIVRQFTGLTAEEQLTLAERELKRMNFDFFNITPRSIKLDQELSNEARGMMGQQVETKLTAFILSDDYRKLPSDTQRKVAIARQLAKYKTEARERALNPERTGTVSGLNKAIRARFLKLPALERMALEDLYKLYGKENNVEVNSVLEDGAYWIMDY